MIHDKSLSLTERVFAAFTAPALSGGMTAPELARFLKVSYSPRITQVLLSLVTDGKLSLDVVKSPKGLAILYRPTEHMPLDAQLTLGGFEHV